MENTEMIMLDEFCASHQVEVSFIHSLEETGLIETVAVNQALYIASDDLPKLEQITRLAPGSEYQSGGHRRRQSFIKTH
jgi:hypothetical protein